MILSIDGLSGATFDQVVNAMVNVVLRSMILAVIVAYKLGLSVLLVSRLCGTLADSLLLGPPSSKRPSRSHMRLSFICLRGTAAIRTDLRLSQRE